MKNSEIPVRSVEGPVVADPALQRPQVRSPERLRIPLVEPLKDSCRTQITFGIGPQQRYDIALPHIGERVRSRPPVTPVLRHVRRQRSRCHILIALSLMAATAAAACCVLPYINFCLSPPRRIDL